MDEYEWSVPCFLGDIYLRTLAMTVPHNYYMQFWAIRRKQHKKTKDLRKKYEEERCYQITIRSRYHQ